MKMLNGFVLSALLAVATPAQNLPDKPAATKETKEFWISTAAVAAAWSADAVTTSEAFARCRNCDESGGLFNGTRNVPEIMGAWAAVDAGLVVLSYEVKQHVHNKYIHPLWRVPLYVRIEAHTQAAVHNSQN